MQSDRLTDLIAKGLGTAARHIGSEYDAFRPVTAQRPLAPTNRYLRLPAAFSTDSGSFHQSVGYSHATWSGIFDTAYTQPGDYLRGAGGTYFISAQQSLLPSLCVLTNRILNIARVMSPGEVGVTGYGGVTRGTLSSVLSDWPASVLANGVGGSTDLPGDGGVAHWTILLPATPARINPADLIRDEAGASYVIVSTELSALGWRLLAKQAES